MLKQHLLFRMQRILGISGSSDSGLLQRPQQSIFLKGDYIYRHKIIRFNYTTYDVRRDQDTINPGTSHCNIMLLSSRQTIPPMSDNSSITLPLPQPHPYLYARVIGIYHANVIYTGPGTVGYTPRRVDFLWVRWYNYHKDETPNRLDQLSFPPITSEGAFGFVDPANVVRSCHIIPRFHQGKRHPNGTGFSRLAYDSDDWLSYYIGR